MPTKTWRLLFLVASGIIFLILTLLMIILNLNKKTASLPVAPTPAPTPTPAEGAILNPSAYATDSAILKIEEEIKTMGKEIQSTDLKESQFNPPILDMDVNLKE